ncbi:hypothetical protein MP228_011249 [Amoeboaphelidium protococcarum]|nr:hypothetical protein MP228_011249 [Amoeboaphelidium protococcarum]
MATNNNAQYAPLPVYDDLEKAPLMASQPQGQGYYPTQIVYVQKDYSEDEFPTQLVLFLVGFIFPLCWFIGSCVPSFSRLNIAFRMVNRVITALTVISAIILIVMFGIIGYHIDQENRLVLD